MLHNASSELRANPKFGNEQKRVDGTKGELELTSPALLENVIPSSENAYPSGNEAGNKFPKKTYSTPG